MDEAGAPQTLGRWAELPDGDVAGDGVGRYAAGSRGGKNRLLQLGVRRSRRVALILLGVVANSAATLSSPGSSAAR
jgi:hypothetical protein